MKREISLCMILCLYLGQSSGCSTVRSWYDFGTESVKSVSSKVMPGERDGLKKKVLVFPLMDQAGIGEERAEEINSALMDLLQRDGNLIVQRSAIPIPTTAGIRSPQLGIVIDPELAQMSEEMGMNVLVTCILSPFETTSKKTGIWPWRKIRRETEISVFVNVFDIINNTLFLTNLESGKIKTSVDISEERGEKTELDKNLLNRALTPIMSRHASAIKSVLKKYPWTGRIISADKNNIIINAGKEVGVKAGSVFEVFGEGESIRSASGQPLYLLGPKAGEIKIEEVMERHSSAVPFSDSQFKPGQAIRLKD